MSIYLYIYTSTSAIRIYKVKTIILTVYVITYFPTIPCQERSNTSYIHTTMHLKLLYSVYMTILSVRVSARYMSICYSSSCINRTIHHDCTAKHR